ncbi:MAG TPA: hypothetical protein VG429_04860 [Casimicrobiaceae bacterium]|nr:hypothetical protein [Casimicrobiaceae bacterium]
MNPQVQASSTVPPPFIVFTLVSLALYSWCAMADELSANPTTMNFAAGGTIRMSLNVGTMEVVGVHDDRITVSWHSRLPEDASGVSVKLQRADGRDATVMVDGPGNRVHYRIEVPQQSSVVIHMRAGDLDVHGILGSVAADLLAGNMDLRVEEPRHYRTVSASVTAGGLTAAPWHADTGGLWRSFTASGDGEFDLHARLLAGQLTIRSE